MLEEITFYRGYTDWLIQSTNCPCNRRTPDPVACLDIAPDILMPKSRPRARSRRRRASTTSSRSNDPDGGPSRGIANLRRSRPCR